MSLSTPSSGLKQEVETRIERIDEVESQSDLPSAIEFYEELNEKLHRLAESDTASPRAGKRIEYVEERLSELYDVQESAMEDADTQNAGVQETDDCDGSDAELAEETNSGAADSDSEFAPTVPEIDLSDYVGREELKAELRSRVLGPYRDPEGVSRFGLSSSSGLLLYGPPGTGKSMLARSLGGEAELDYIEVKIPDIKDRYVGSSEENVKQLFEVAAENTPCVVCMDEVDALATERGADSSSAGKDDMINTLLDALERAPEGVLAIGTTNRRDRIDAAFERKDRFEKTIEVGLPERDDRRALLEHYMETPVSRPCDDDLRLGAIVEMTDDYSCADLHQLVEEAAWDAYERDQRRISLKNFKNGLNTVDPVEYDY